MNLLKLTKLMKLTTLITLLFTFSIQSAFSMTCHEYLNAKANKWKGKNHCISEDEYFGMGMLSIFGVGLIYAIPRLITHKTKKMYKRNSWQAKANLALEINSAGSPLLVDVYKKMRRRNASVSYELIQKAVLKDMGLEPEKSALCMAITRGHSHALIRALVELLVNNDLEKNVAPSTNTSSSTDS